MFKLNIIIKLRVEAISYVETQSWCVFVQNLDKEVTDLQTVRILHRYQ